MSETKRSAEGWGFPGSARKAHYFVEATALCRKWGLFAGPLEADNGPSRDDCAACRRALDARVVASGDTGGDQ